MRTKSSTATKAPPARKAAERSGQARHKKSPLPEVPDKLYYRIGEVARLCGVETYVLRFWETEFPQLKPNKSGTGQRLYRRREVDLARHIRHLLYEEGYTIPGARQAIQAETRRPENGQLPLGEGAGKTPPKLGRLRTELKEILGMLSTSPGPATPDITAPGSIRRRTRNGQREAKAGMPELFD